MFGSFGSVDRRVDSICNSLTESLSIGYCKVTQSFVRQSFVNRDSLCKLKELSTRKVVVIVKPPFS